MYIPSWRSCGRGASGVLKRKLCAHKFKFVLGLLALLAMIPVYMYEPWRTALTLKKPSSYLTWRDHDFRLRADANEREMIILRWTSHWGGQRDAIVLTAADCPFLKLKSTTQKDIIWPVFDIPCRITFDRRYSGEANALVFSSWDLLKEEIPNPKEKPADQVWVYYQQESPGNKDVKLGGYPNVFNWTMTYRRDSDIYYPYAHVVPRKHDFRIDPKLGKRPKLLAWIVSDGDSHSKREYFAKQLQKYIPISIYGRCGKKCCSKTDIQLCYYCVGDTHKFYLSFENSLCVDYITEKFFHALRANLVPIVYGGTDSEEYSAIAPKGSYIDARDFETAKELAEYLIYLDQNEEEYMKYFEWKRKWKVIGSQGWCNLCQRVYEQLQCAPESSTGREASDREGKHKWHKDLSTWWEHKRYDPRFEEDKVTVATRVGVVGERDEDVLGAPACTPPIKGLIGYEETKTFMESGILRVKDFGRWFKDGVFGCF